MPESSQDQLAQFSRNCTEIDETDDDSLPDIGELLGFRITGGRDFFMPITIFHVSAHIIMSVTVALIDLSSGKREQSRRKSEAQAGRLDTHGEWKGHDRHDAHGGESLFGEGDCR